MTLVANADGSRVGWVEVKDGGPILVNAPTEGGTTIRTRAAEATSTPTATPVGFLADGTLVFTTADPGDDVRERSSGYADHQAAS